MLEAHRIVGVAVLVVTAAAVVCGASALWGRGPSPRLLAHTVVLAQTVLIAQVGLGLLLLSDGRRAPDRLHYAYGVFALLAVLSPWLYAPREPRRRLLWFVGATLCAGALAGRAYMTSS
jgi:hypothetical protein